MSGYHPNRAEYSGHNRKYPTGYRISTGWISQKSLIASKHYIKIVLWVTYLTFRMIIIFIYVQITPTYIHVYSFTKTDSYTNLTRLSTEKITESNKHFIAQLLNNNKQRTKSL